MFERAGDLGLADEPGDQAGVDRPVVAEFLQGHLAAEVVVAGQPDPAEPADPVDLDLLEAPPGGKSLGSARRARWGLRR